MSNPQEALAEKLKKTQDKRRFTTKMRQEIGKMRQ
jgi:hypothetical protein